MEKMACLKLLVLFLGFSYVLSSSSVSAIRSLKSENDNDPSQVQDFLAQEAMKLSDSEEVFGMEQGFVEGRMDMESTDYTGTGANHHHDPKTPGRA